MQYTANPPAPEITVPSYQEQVSDVPAVPSQVKITASGALIALPAAAAATPVPEPVSVLGAGVLATTAAWCVRRRRPA